MNIELVNVVATVDELQLDKRAGLPEVGALVDVMPEHRTSCPPTQGLQGSAMISCSAQIEGL